MGHKSHHHSREKERDRSKHRHHKSKSHSKRSSSQSSNSSSDYSSSDSYSHNSHKKRKLHHKHHHKDRKKEKNNNPNSSKTLKKERLLTDNEVKIKDNIITGASLPSDSEETNIIKSKLNKNNNESINDKILIGPVLPSFLENNKDDDSNNENDSLHLIGPSLPPSYNENNTEQKPKIIGPSLPPSYNENNTEQKSKMIGPSLPSSYNENSTEQKSKVIGPFQPTDSVNEIIKKPEEESDDEIIGPLPMAPGHELTEEEETQRIINEFEERADRMKRKLEGKDEPEKPKKLVRDEWMTTLPEDNILDRINILKPRQFRKNGITKIDRSGWTDTPSDKLRKQKEGTKNKEEKVEYIQINKNDIEMQKMVDQYNKEHRNESLYDQHAKEYFKNKKYEENDISKLPFNRERDVLGAGSKGSIGKTNQLKNVLDIESTNRFIHSSSKRFL